MFWYIVCSYHASNSSLSLSVGPYPSLCLVGILSAPVVSFLGTFCRYTAVADGGTRNLFVQHAVLHYRLPPVLIAALQNNLTWQGFRFAKSPM